MQSTLSFRCWSNGQVRVPLLSSTNGSWTRWTQSSESSIWLPSRPPQERSEGPWQHSTCCVSELMLWVRDRPWWPLPAVPWWGWSTSIRCNMDRGAWFPHRTKLQTIQEVPGQQEFPKKKKLFAYYVCKLRGEEPKEAAEGPDLRRKPLSLTQPSSLSTFLSALGQFGDLPSQLQKQLQSTKAIMPKSVKSMCENCKGSERKMMVCGQCRQAYYCSRECQKKDWKQHKKSCATRKEWRKFFILISITYPAIHKEYCPCW